MGASTRRWLACLAVVPMALTSCSDPVPEAFLFACNVDDGVGCAAGYECIRGVCVGPDDVAPCGQYEEFIKTFFTDELGVLQYAGKDCRVVGDSCEDPFTVGFLNDERDDPAVLSSVPFETKANLALTNYGTTGPVFSSTFGLSELCPSLEGGAAGAAPDHVYEFRPPKSGRYRVRVKAATRCADVDPSTLDLGSLAGEDKCMLDSVVGIVRGCRGTEPVCVAANDDTETFFSRVVADLQGGVAYLVVVDAYQWDAAGEYKLHIDACEGCELEGVEAGDTPRVDCTSDTDCDDGNACSSDACVGGGCVWGAADDGTACASSTPSACQTELCWSGACVGFDLAPYGQAGCCIGDLTYWCEVDGSDQSLRSEVCYDGCGWTGEFYYCGGDSSDPNTCQPAWE